MKKLLLTSIAALFLATGTAHAHAGELTAWLGYNTGKYIVPGLIVVFLIYGFIYRPLIERRRK